jgi:hypothetical protein
MNVYTQKSAFPAVIFVRKRSCLLASRMGLNCGFYATMVRFFMLYIIFLVLNRLPWVISFLLIRRDRDDQLLLMEQKRVRLQSSAAVLIGRSFSCGSWLWVLLYFICETSWFVTGDQEGICSCCLKSFFSSHWNYSIKDVPDSVAI